MNKLCHLSYLSQVFGKKSFVSYLTFEKESPMSGGKAVNLFFTTTKSSS